tara:strand:+ start:7297 stop:8133 length:837 start_codon:yes stop_codon:yes gene_type:complete
MAEQKRRSPGRPKKVQAQDTDTAVAAPSTPKIKWEEKQDSRMTAEEWVTVRSKNPVALIIKQKNVTVYDSEKDKIRSIRYCPNEDSIWTEEQSEFATVGAIIFRNGRLIVRSDQPNLKKFLRAHPGNAANGGSTFKLRDTTKKISQELETEFKAAEVVSMVRDKDILDLVPVAIYFGVNVDAKSSEIRHNLLRIAKRDPKAFIESFDSPQVQTRAQVQQANDFDIIKVKSDGVYWTDSNTLIVSIPAGMDGYDVMTRFCLTEKGSLVHERIKEELAKL